MNILLLTSVYPEPNQNNQDVTKVVKFFAQEWTKSGHTVKVIHNVHKYPAAVHALPTGLKKKIASKINFVIPSLSQVKNKYYKDGEVEVWRMPIKKYNAHGGHPNFVINNQIKRISRQIDSIGFKPDIIMGHWMSPQAQLISGLKDIYGCQTSLVLHGRLYVADKKFNCEQYLKNIDAIGCRSEAESRFVQRVLKFNDAPYICYSGVPDEFVNKYKYNPHKFDQKPDIWKFIYVGRLVGYKNLDKVLTALARIKNQNYQFDIIGEGAEMDNLKAQAEKLGISEKVIFHGRIPREEVLEYMKDAHTFVMISKGEVFGLVYLEAMTTSCINIGSIGEGIDGIIVDGKNGFLSKPADAEELQKTIETVMDMPGEKLNEITREGFETAKAFRDSLVSRDYLENANKSYSYWR